LTWGENIPADLVKELEAIKEPFLADLKERLELVNIEIV